MLWTDDSNDWQIGSNPAYTIDSVTSNVARYIAAGNPVILLEHDLRDATVEVAQMVSEMVSEAGRVNCPVSAVYGDAQRYQGTRLTWPVAGPYGFDPSFNPIIGTIM